MSFDLYQEITNRIMSQLEAGVVPWHKPWAVSGMALSHVNGKPYSLLNQLMLGEPGEYITFKQCQAEGGKIRKGAHSRMVVFWKMLNRPIKNKDGSEKTTAEGKPMFETIPYLQYYNVFHINDCEDIKPKYPLPEGAEVHADAQAILDGYVARSGVRLVHMEQDKAYYTPALDKIVLPLREQFKSTGEYYATAFHEATHSTGHPSRLNRLDKQAHFGNEEYSKEELVAEIGSATLVAKAGLETESTFDNSVAYIQSWLKALKNDKRMIVSAAGKAEKAVNLILGV